MKPADDDPLEGQLAELLAACDEALAAGLPPPPVEDGSLPEALRPRLRRARALLSLLEDDRLRSRLTPLDRFHRPARHVSFDPAAGTGQIGRFRLLRELGCGGYGIVFLALDPLLDREVALKVPRAEVVLEPELRRRFLLEARAAAGLQHPNLVPVYEAGEAGPFCYLASDYCRGPTLAAWLREHTRPVPPRDAAALVAALADTEKRPGEAVPEERLIETETCFLAIEVEPGEEVPPREWVPFQGARMCYRRWKEGDDLKPGKLALARETLRLRKLEVGDRVKKGQLIGFVDPAVSLGDVSVKLAKLEGAGADVRMAEMTRDEVQRRYLAMKKARDSVQGTPSRDELEAATRQWLRGEDEVMDKATALSHARHELHVALTRLRMHAIHSPVRGVVKAIYRQKGEAVRVGEPVLHISER